MAAAREQQQTCPDPERGELFEDAEGAPRRSHPDKAMEMYINGELTSNQEFFVQEALRDLTDMCLSMLARDRLSDVGTNFMSTCQVCQKQFGSSLDMTILGKPEVPCVSVRIHVSEVCLCDPENNFRRIPPIFRWGISSATVTSFIAPRLDCILQAIRTNFTLKGWRVSISTSCRSYKDGSLRTACTGMKLPEAWLAHEWPSVLDSVKLEIIRVLPDVPMGLYDDLSLTVSFSPSRLNVPGLN